MGQVNKQAQVNAAIVRQIYMAYPEFDRFQVAKMFLRMTGMMIDAGWCEQHRPEGLAPKKKRRPRKAS